ncbi:TonB-dependent receptor [Mangrovimicrobium sediminis]|uniref:TonB-dependent receptor n=1 Tax=Mangrovimicrobium sediminis TaxID=2562682 RepID=A0A4Z0M487_9GAMM|nr:TonB-dependent receptor [Haliea sp. SAOS-164]TGD74311.1 TonB-dependent receptor [Haliea sp. SAOS-164]
MRPIKQQAVSGPARAFHGRLALALAVSLAAGHAGVAVAQGARPGVNQVLLEEVIVTARKREESVQAVPLSVSAYSGDQLDALKVRDLQSLSVGMPNVALDDAATARGYANFAIRGLGINSSIVSIDPTVGVFVDGVYLGLPAGTVFDVFDLERIEVLRGPQGTLFGRNVTGGAVLISTRKPGEELEASVRAAIDGGDQGGLNKYLMGTIGGPITDTLGGKFTAYYNDDDGWFENEFTGDDFGAVEQTMFRGVGVWSPGERTELILRWEHAENDSDGPASQNHVNGSGVPGAFATFDRDSHDLSIDEEGYYNTETDFVTLEFNQDVAFGDGTITNIFGWRNYEAESRGDIDSQPVWLFHSGTWTEAEQFSNELRYSGTFADRAAVTTGLYYFTNDIDYHERRELLGIATGGIAPAAIFDGGGYYSVDTYAAFGALDYNLTDSLILNLGLRYTYEEKEAEVASLSQNISQGGAPTCNLVSPAPGEATCTPDFIDDEDWSSWSPKVGMTYELSDNSRVYGHWTRGFRSGGYNLRNTSFDPADVPGPFDEETVDNFELGYKSEWDRGRLNLALFYNEVEDMQRELNFAGPIGVIQLVRNTADAEILGVEVDGAFSITDTLLLTGSVGWIDASYSDVSADLNRDGVIDGADKALDLPRAAEWTYSIGLNHELALGDWGYLASRLSYAYRDDSAYTDDNLGYLLDQEILDAGIDFHSANGNWTVGIYGNNLLDDVKHGGDTQLPDTISGVPAGGTFAPLAKGRYYGVQVTWNL